MAYFSLLAQYYQACKIHPGESPCQAVSLNILADTALRVWSSEKASAHQPGVYIRSVAYQSVESFINFPLKKMATTYPLLSAKEKRIWRRLNETPISSELIFVADDRLKSDLV